MTYTIHVVRSDGFNYPVLDSELNPQQFTEAELADLVLASSTYPVYVYPILAPSQTRNPCPPTM